MRNEWWSCAELDEFDEGGVVEYAGVADRRSAVKRAISELRETYNKVIDGEEWPYLVEVAKEKVIANRNDAFRSLLFRRYILEYRYLDDEGEIQVWHDVHPLIRGLEGFKRACQSAGGG